MHACFVLANLSHTPVCPKNIARPHFSNEMHEHRMISTPTWNGKKNCMLSRDRSKRNAQISSLKLRDTNEETKNLSLRKNRLSAIQPFLFSIFNYRALTQEQGTSRYSNSGKCARDVLLTM